MVTSKRKASAPPALPQASGVVVPDAIDGAIVAFHLAFRNVVSGADQRLAEMGLGRSHHKILFHAARHDRCPISDIRDFIGVSRQALQRPLADLYRLGMIETVVAPENRRIHQLVLTAEGAVLEREVTALVRAHFEAVFGRLGNAHRLHWMATMEALGSS
ncbi:MarR family winged helix-turn-helix transcriptional regulator [Hydrogenophaga sp.]|jgi:DNA-binding MarR family transcriptional regulator|uniref:MarR family winged helix-turn-helix transcriptional regulator n=1 Tax=Hydrogenophaga sp. TaxID=1904254 RepID=UPI003F6F65F3